MVSTQRLTSLAYNVADGQSDDDKVSPNIKPHVVKYDLATSYICSYRATMSRFYCSHTFRCLSDPISVDVCATVALSCPESVLAIILAAVSNLCVSKNVVC